MPAPKSITPKVWEHIVSVFAKHDGRVEASRKELGWPQARARRVFNRGYPSCGYPPIRTLIAHDALTEQEVRAARSDIEAGTSGDGGGAAAQLPEAIPPTPRRGTKAALAAAEQRRMSELLAREAERDKARADAVKSRAEEAALVSVSRRNAIALNAVTAQVLRGASQLAAKIQRALELEAAQESGLSLAQQLSLVRQAAQIARFNAEAASLAIKSERLVLGQPLDEHPDAAGDSLEEAASWVEASVRAVQRARARGLLVLAIDGSEGSGQRVSSGLQIDAPLEPANPAGELARVELPTAAEERVLRRQRVRTRGLVGLAGGAQSVPKPSEQSGKAG